ncbi:MAG: hypothetical protein NWE89_07780 [Candidatus Bathyarchaeota archaeon]|nr:hypothetical protein [Candidatus Bathyarchaeota archaeon]
METREIKETLMNLYEKTLETHSGASKDVINLIMTFSLFFTAAGFFVDKGLSSLYLPALLGMGSFLAMYIVMAHFWRMNWYYESQLIRFEINHIIEHGEPSPRFSLSKISKAYERGTENNDLGAAALGLGYVLLGILGSMALMFSLIPVESMRFLIPTQVMLLVLPVAFICYKQYRHQINSYNCLYKQFYTEKLE